jgi:hypothetical protein
MLIQQTFTMINISSFVATSWNCLRKYMELSVGHTHDVMVYVSTSKYAKEIKRIYHSPIHSISLVDV